MPQSSPQPDQLCASCGNPIITGEAYTDGCGGGPWHKVCVPSHLVGEARKVERTEVPYLRVVK